MKLPHRLAATFLFSVVSSVSTLVEAAAVSGQGTWQATLQARDLDGDPTTAEAFYDTVLDITWLKHANFLGGASSWSYVSAWAANLDPYGSGITGWRLPTVNPIDGTTADDANISYIGTEDRGNNMSAPGTLYAGSTASEMAHLFYNTLGNKGYCDPSTSTDSVCNAPQPGWGLTNTGPFASLHASYGRFFSSTTYAPDTEYAWGFSFSNGFQEPTAKLYSYYAWAVHSGDVGWEVSYVPVPAAAWLFASGLIGLVGFRRRHRK